MSDFEDLCNSMGLSVGDPDAIDKLIDMCADDEDDYEDNYQPSKETKHIKFQSLDNINDGIDGNFVIIDDTIGVVEDDTFFLSLIHLLTNWEQADELYPEVSDELTQFAGSGEWSFNLSTHLYSYDGIDCAIVLASDKEVKLR